MDKNEDQNNGDLPSKSVRSRATEAERQAEARRERAARTLRENLLRRKQQGRARRAGAADETSGLPAAPSEERANQGEPAELAAKTHESGE
ncbi:MULTISPECIES: hypothetical protein [unclassified Rhizobium]|uniref:hypothetical protein n=1 Tax=unclassified Rhizobium TaxID=2613769 RepID=UPI0006F6823B|nr:MULTISPECIES: hypothetical protein [unclassified Rhizobium]KQV44574.1 hypothetical protein ASC86_04150 [Rhizobium sp. Root1212]KRD38757.1 hypothetical protein ASE37_04150 [Rhizobium sp. Root268]